MANYWGEREDDALRRWQVETDVRVRNRIYTESLHGPLWQMVTGIIKAKFKDLLPVLDEVASEVISYLFERCLSHVDYSQKDTAFSYLTVCARNACIAYFRRQALERSRLDSPLRYEDGTSRDYTDHVLDRGILPREPDADINEKEQLREYITFLEDWMAAQTGRGSEKRRAVCEALLLLIREPGVIPDNLRFMGPGGVTIGQVISDMTGLPRDKVVDFVRMIRRAWDGDWDIMDMSPYEVTLPNEKAREIALSPENVYGLTESCIYNRVNLAGLTVAEALSTPPYVRSRRVRESRPVGDCSTGDIHREEGGDGAHR